MSNITPFERLYIFSKGNKLLRILSFLKKRNVDFSDFLGLCTNKNLYFEKLTRHAHKSNTDPLQYPYTLKYIDIFSVAHVINWDIIAYDLRNGHSAWLNHDIFSNKTIRWEHVLEFPNLEWDWSMLSVFIPISIITENTGRPWVYERMGSNQTLTIEFIIENIHEHWDYDLISKNKNVTTIENIKKYPNFLWVWCLIEFDVVTDEIFQFLIDNQSIVNWNAASKYVPFKYVRTHTFLPWHWKELCRNKSIPIEFIEKFAKGVNFFDDNPHQLIHPCSCLEESPNLTIETIKKYKSVYGFLGSSAHSNITMRTIISNPGISWTQKYVFMNPNLTFSYFKKMYVNKTYLLEYNEFLYDERFRRNEMQRDNRKLSRMRGGLAFVGIY